MTRKDANKNKKKIWESFSHDEYLQAAASMVHYSVKIINSNAAAFGIRLNKDFKYNLPYIAACTMNRSDIRMDYSQNNHQTRKVNQINDARHQLNGFESIPETNIIAIQSCEEILAKDYISAGPISMRVRQIILQTNNNIDITATPLSCAGLSVLINDRINEERERENLLYTDKNQPKFIQRTHGFLGLGGSQPQNVSAHTHALKKTIMFTPPRATDESDEIKHALSIYHKGIPIKPNCSLIKKFILWRKIESKQYFIDNPSNLSIRNQLCDFLAKLTKYFMTQVDEEIQLLMKHRDKLPNTEDPFSPTLSALQQGLLDTSRRNSQWIKEFADQFHKKIISQAVWINKKQTSLNVSKHESLAWISIIEDTLRNLYE